MTKSDREWAYLSEQTGMKAPFNDMYFRYLRGLGYTGTLQDMIAASGLGFSPSKYVPPYDPSASSLFDRFDNDPTPERKTLINDLIVALKDEGIWSKLDALWLMAAADAQGARLNWVADQYNLTPVSAPTFTADRGYAGDGSSSYLNTGLVLADAENFTLNDAHISAYSRTDQSDARVIMGSRSAGPANQTLIQSRTTGGYMSARVNQLLTTGSEVISPSSAGLLFAQRIGPTAKEYYRNGAQLGTTSEASDGLSPYPLFLSTLNTAGSPVSFDNRQIATASVGSSLSSGEVAAYYNALNTYLTAIGAAI